MLKKVLYILWVIIFAGILFFILKTGSFYDFLQSMENRTFDIRQNLIVNSETRIHNKDIVILAIDDASYEYIVDHYGEWPLRRDLYAKIVDYIEAQNPKSIAFDLMFVKSMKSDAKSDQALIDVFKKYDNVFTAMNLDNQPQDLRMPQVLPDKLSVNNKNIQKPNIMEYSNCRVILQGIIDATKNIGMINVSRSNDGVLRRMPVFLKYQDKLYPQLGFLVGSHYLGGNDINSLIENDGNGEGVILNWYGKAGTFENIPLYKLLKSIENNEKFDYDFHNKIVYIGATASSLFDIKTVPVDKVYPGVEVQATYVNNIIDKSYIIRVPLWLNIVFGIILSILTVLFVMKIVSMPLAFCLSLTVYTFYIALTYLLMKYGNLWVDIIIPLAISLTVFIVAVITKYLIKSRDFDRQYKLATTDGLTDLYNHRYFQEQMQMFCQNSKRYDTVFSLIILDIDYFKKFNDNFGHQSGDAVLRQVAQLLKKNVRSADIVCRYGGEEMSIILPNTKAPEAENTATKLCNIIAQHQFNLSHNRQSNVTVSLGVSTYGIDGIEPSILIEAADKRLYNAKNNGRNRVN